jgi:hypothetical protein
MSQTRFPPGWDEERVRKILAHYEGQTEEEATAEDEAAFEDPNQSVDIYFTDYFQVSPLTLEEYGAFNVSLINDLPLFIDPFLLFNSEKGEYQRLHDQMIEYLRFLRDKSMARRIDEGLLRSWFTFSEVKQNWLGFSKSGNAGSGLGLKFARALNRNLNTLFADFGQERVTEGSHLEKLTLIETGVGRDNISDFTTNLVKNFLLEYTQTFAQQYVDPDLRRRVAVDKVQFSYVTETWESGRFDLPWDGEDYVLLTPKDILTKDENWINRNGLIANYDDIVDYLRSKLPEDYSAKEEREARADVFRRFPELIEYYVRYKEERGEEAKAYSDMKVAESERLYIEQVRDLVDGLLTSTGFYDQPGRTHQEARDRVMFLKDIIENKGGQRLFYANGEPIRRESDLQILFRLTWFATPSDVSREVNDGRGPVDFKVSRGNLDKSLVEFKLASNTRLYRNLEKQVDVYKAASDTPNALKVILFFTDTEHAKVLGILQELGLEGNPDIILIDGRADNKPSGSKA